MECEYQIKGTTLRIFLPQELIIMYLPDCGKKQILWWRHILSERLYLTFPALTGWTVPASVSFLGGIKT